MSKLIMELSAKSSVEEAKDLERALDLVEKILVETDSKIQMAAKSFKLLSDTNAKAKTKIDLVGKSLSSLTAKMSANAAVLGVYDERLAEIEGQFDRYKSILGDVREETIELNKESRKTATGLKTVTTPLKQATKSLNKLDTQTKKTKKTTKSLLNTMSDRVAGKVTNSFVDNMTRAARAIGLLERRGKEATAVQSKLGGAIDVAGVALGTFSGNILAAAAQKGIALFTEGISQASRAIVQLGLDVDRAKRTISILTGDMQSATKEFEFAKQTADQLGLAYVGVTKEYAKFLAAGKSSTLDIKQQRDVFQSFSKALAATQASAQDTELVFLALNQMVSKGKVSSEELRRQLAERLPGAFQAAAKSAGLTVAELDKFLKQGAILTDDFLPGFAREIELIFGRTADAAAQSGLQASLNQMENALKGFGEALLDLGIEDAIKGIARATKGLLDGLTRIAESDKWEFIKEQLKDLIESPETSAESVTKAIQEMNKSVSSARLDDDKFRALKVQIKEVGGTIFTVRERIGELRESLARISSGRGTFLQFTREQQEIKKLEGTLKALQTTYDGLQTRAKAFTKEQRDQSKELIKQKLAESQEFVKLQKMQERALKNFLPKEKVLIDTRKQLIATEKRFNELADKRFQKMKLQGKLNKEQQAEGPQKFFQNAEQRQEVLAGLAIKVNKAARASAEEFIRSQKALFKSNEEIRIFAKGSDTLTGSAKKAVNTILLLSEARKGAQVVAKNLDKKDNFTNQIEFLEKQIKRRQELNKLISDSQRRVTTLESDPKRAEDLASEKILLSDLKVELKSITNEEKARTAIKNLNNKIAKDSLETARQLVNEQLKMGTPLGMVQEKLKGNLGLQKEIAQVISQKEFAFVNQVHARYAEINDRRRETVEELDRIINKLSSEKASSEDVNKLLKDKQKILDDISKTNTSEALKEVTRLREQGVAFKNITLNNLKLANVSQSELTEAVQQRARAELKSLERSSGYTRESKDQVSLARELTETLGLEDAQRKALVSFMETKQKKAQEALNKRGESFLAIWENSADTISGAVTDSILGLKTSFSDVIEHIGREMLQLTVKQNIVKPFQSAITALITGTSPTTPSPTRDTGGSAGLGSLFFNQAVGTGNDFGNLPVAPPANPFNQAPLPTQSAAPASASRSQGPSVVVEDHRSVDSPEIEVREQSTLGGQKQIHLMVRDGVRDGIARGEFDDQFRNRFGLLGRPS